jgi:hypothetical protein
MLIQDIVPAHKTLTRRRPKLRIRGRSIVVA